MRWAAIAPGILNKLRSRPNAAWLKFGALAGQDARAKVVPAAAPVNPGPRLSAPRRATKAQIGSEM